MLSANESAHVRRFFEPAAVHPRLIVSGDERLELDDYLEILLSQARRAARVGRAGPGSQAGVSASACEGGPWW